MKNTCSWVRREGEKSCGHYKGFAPLTFQLGIVRKSKIDSCWFTDVTTAVLFSNEMGVSTDIIFCISTFT